MSGTCSPTVGMSFPCPTAARNTRDARSVSCSLPSLTLFSFSPSSPVFAAVLRFRVRLVEGAFRRGLPSIRRVVPLRLMRGYISTSRMPCRCRLRFERTLRTDLGTDWKFLRTGVAGGVPPLSGAGSSFGELLSPRPAGTFPASAARSPPL